MENLNERQQDNRTVDAAAHEQENEPQAVAAAEIEIIHVSPPYF